MARVGSQWPGLEGVLTGREGEKPQVGSSLPRPPSGSPPAVEAEAGRGSRQGDEGTGQPLAGAEWNHWMDSSRGEPGTTSFQQLPKAGLRDAPTVQDPPIPPRPPKQNKQRV